jgi:hypothetical protein
MIATLGALAPAALATHVSCGDTITQDTKLDSDLIDCPDRPVLVGADDITLDLNGHTISDSGKPILDWRSGLTVEDGTLDNTRIQLGGPETGGPSFGGLATHTTLTNLTIVGDGVDLANAADTVIRRNVFVDAGVENGDRYNDSTDAVIEKNSWTINGLRTAISLGWSEDSRIVGNRISVGALGAGIEIDVAFDALIERNWISGGFWGIGIARGHVSVIKNHISGAASDGIYKDRSGGSEFIGNVLTGNGDDGLEIDEGGGTDLVARNTANDNGDFGIEATQSVIDGGGNKASGNGNPLQCLNVFCK